MGSIRIGVAVFSYIRKQHLERTLDSLRNNTVKPQKLFLFHDGEKNESEREKWNQVQDVIDSQKWCDTEVIVNKTNKGLANSIIDGINYVLRSFDAVIVIEDDCVTDCGFMSFMTEGLNLYKNYERVYGVSGYAWPCVKKCEDRYDAYFTGRVSSWGWGTWKTKWSFYERDDEIIKRIRKDKNKSIQLGIWGNDLEIMLGDRLKGRNDSWAVYWALKVIENQGVYLTPYESLVLNTGFDGTGTNCGISNDYNVTLSSKTEDGLIFPKEISITEETKLAFVRQFGGYTALIQNTNRRKMIVYGTGHYWVRNEELISRDYSVCAFMDAAKEGFYSGKPIIEKRQLCFYKGIPIIIMLEDRRMGEYVKCELEAIVNGENPIFLGIDIYG